MTHGILLIDKPKGLTSYDVIRLLKKRMGQHLKMGHAGTLDPAATGLLIVGVGKDTKKLSRLLKLPKTYLAEILLGVQTTTGDMDGEIIREENVDNLDQRRVKEVLNSMVGELILPVPVYAAIKIKGTPIYQLARRGVAIKPPRRKMHILEAAFLGEKQLGKHRLIRARFKVGSGTYIRSLAEEIGRRLGVPATVRELRRTAIGNFRLSHARPPQEITILSTGSLQSKKDGSRHNKQGADYGIEI